jgi:hypothetical protein
MYVVWSWQVRWTSEKFSLAEVVGYWLHRRSILRRCTLRLQAELPGRGRRLARWSSCRLAGRGGTGWPGRDSPHFKTPQLAGVTSSSARQWAALPAAFSRAATSDVEEYKEEVEHEEQPGEDGPDVGKHPTPPCVFPLQLACTLENSYCRNCPRPIAIVSSQGLWAKVQIAGQLDFYPLRLPKNWSLEPRAASGQHWSSTGRLYWTGHRPARWRAAPSRPSGPLACPCPGHRQAGPRPDSPVVPGRH